jgi:2,4-dienoyl-CoA reductase-like NADH-dependent reductase (Old Yellow Enzyme family)
MSLLFTPYQLGPLRLKNRIAIAPGRRRAIVAFLVQNSW